MQPIGQTPVFTAASNGLCQLQFPSLRPGFLRRLQATHSFRKEPKKTNDVSLIGRKGKMFTYMSLPVTGYIFSAKYYLNFKQIFIFFLFQ